MGTTTIYRREALIAAGGFDPTLLGYADGFASRLIAVTTGCCFIPEILASWRRLDDSISSNTASFSVVLKVADHAVEQIETVHRSRFARLATLDAGAAAGCSALSPYGCAVDRARLGMMSSTFLLRSASLIGWRRLRPFEVCAHSNTVTVFRCRLRYRLVG